MRSKNFELIELVSHVMGPPVHFLVVVSRRKGVQEVFWHSYKLTETFDTCSISRNMLVAMVSGLLGDPCALPQT